MAAEFDGIHLQKPSRRESIEQAKMELREGCDHLSTLGIEVGTGGIVRGSVEEARQWVCENT